MIARTRGTILCLSAGLALGASVVAAGADTRLNAHYAISMVGVSVGQLTWTVDVGANAYRASANGKASGPFSILVKGEGRIATRGRVSNGELTPSFFSSRVTDDDETTGLQMAFEDGAIKTLRFDTPPPQDANSDGRIPVHDADMSGVTDPLSAMLIAAPADDRLAPENCDRLLPIFDGQRRYNLALSFKRIENLKINHGPAGPVLVCAVMLQPVAGYRPDSLLVKHVGGRRDMEIWFSPIAGTALAAPVRLVMPTVVGTLEISADRFEAAASSPDAIAPRR